MSPTERDLLVRDARALADRFEYEHGGRSAEGLLSMVRQLAELVERDGTILAVVAQEERPE